MSRAFWRTSSVCNNFGFSRPWMTGNSASHPPPPYLKGNINSPIKFINCAMFPENKTGKCFSPFHHQEIPRRNSICNVTAWSSFLENTSRKFLSLLLFYLPVFLLQLSSAFAIIFVERHGLSCVHVRASWYTLLFRVSLLGVGLRCLDLAQKISARCKRASNTGSYLFSFFFICIFIHLLALSYMNAFLMPSARSLGFGSGPWKVNIY